MIINSLKKLGNFLIPQYKLIPHFAYITRQGNTSILMNAIRLLVTSSSSSAATVNEIQIRTVEDGASITTSGTASASSTGGTSVASRAFDVNNTTAWLSATGSAVGQWIQFNFNTAVDFSTLVECAFLTTSASFVGYSWQYTTDGGTTWTTFRNDAINTTPKVASTGYAYWITSTRDDIAQIDHSRFTSGLGSILISQGNTRFTGSSVCCLCNKTKTSGIYQFELTLNSLTGSFGFGLAASTMSLTSNGIGNVGGYGASFTSVSGAISTMVIVNGSGGSVYSSTIGGLGQGAGTVLTLVWDRDNNKLWLWINGTYYGELQSGLPSGLFPAASLVTGTTDLTMNFGWKPFSIPLQKGAQPYQVNPSLTYTSAAICEIWKLTIPTPTGQVSLQEWRLISGGTNLLTGGTCTSPSWGGSTLLPANATDGSTSTSWTVTSNTAGNIYLEYRLPSGTSISPTSMEIVGTGTSNRPTSYVLSKSTDDGRTYTTIKSGSLTYSGSPATATVSIP